MRMPVSEFKAKCTQILRDVSAHPKTIEITNRGRVIAMVTPPPTSESGINPAYGCLEGTVTFHEGWDEPLGEDDWEACK